MRKAEEKVIFNLVRFAYCIIESQSLLQSEPAIQFRISLQRELMKEFKRQAIQWYSKEKKIIFPYNSETSLFANGAKKNIPTQPEKNVCFSRAIKFLLLTTVDY